MYVQYVHTIVDIVILNGKAMNQDIGKNVQIVVTKQLRKNMEQMEENMKTQQHVQNQDINNMFA